MSAAYEEKLGTVKVSDEVIAVCAMNVTMNTAGISSLSKGIGDSISGILGKEPSYKGIKVSQNEDGVVIDIFPIVVYGVKIPEIAFNIQRNVKNEIEHILGQPVKAVNIHVQGVDIKQDK